MCMGWVPACGRGMDLKTTHGGMMLRRRVQVLPLLLYTYDSLLSLRILPEKNI